MRPLSQLWTGPQEEPLAGPRTPLLRELLSLELSRGRAVTPAESRTEPLVWALKSVFEGPFPGSLVTNPSCEKGAWAPPEGTFLLPAPPSPSLGSTSEEQP